MTYSAPPLKKPVIFIAFYFIVAKTGNTPANVVASARSTFTKVSTNLVLLRMDIL